MDLNTQKEKRNLIEVWSNSRWPKLVRTKAMHYCYYTNKVSIISFCLQDILQVRLSLFNVFPPQFVSFFCGWSLESSLWPSCSTSKYHSNTVERRDSVMWDRGPVIFVPLHYTELLIVSGGIFIPCPWFLYTHATSPSTQQQGIQLKQSQLFAAVFLSSSSSFFFFYPPACFCYHVCPTL